MMRDDGRERGEFFKLEFVFFLRGDKWETFLHVDDSLNYIYLTNTILIIINKVYRQISQKIKFNLILRMILLLGWTILPLLLFLLIDFWVIDFMRVSWRVEVLPSLNRNVACCLSIIFCQHFFIVIGYLIVLFLLLQCSAFLFYTHWSIS